MTTIHRRIDPRQLGDITGRGALVAALAKQVQGRFIDQGEAHDHHSPAPTCQRRRLYVWG